MEAWVGSRVEAVRPLSSSKRYDDDKNSESSDLYRSKCTLHQTHRNKHYKLYYIDVKVMFALN